MSHLMVLLVGEGLSGIRTLHHVGQHLVVVGIAQHVIPNDETYFSNRAQLRIEHAESVIDRNMHHSRMGAQGTIVCRIAVLGQMDRFILSKQGPQPFRFQDCRFAGLSWIIRAVEVSCQICRAPMLPRALARSSARSAARMWTGALTARSIGFNSPEHRLSCWCPPQVPQVGKVVGGGRGHDSGKQLCFFWNRGSTLNCVFGNGSSTFDSRVGTQVLH